MRKNTNPIISHLQREQDGYVMLHEEMGIEVTCTEAYRKQWEQRGFKVKSKGKVNLLKKD